MSEIIKIGEVQSTPSQFIISGTDGKQYDIQPLLAGIDKLVQAQKMAVRNPRDAGAAYKLIREGAMTVGAVMQRLPAAVHPVLRPLVQAAQGPMLEAAKEAVRIRMRSSHDLMKNPTQSIPLTLDESTFVPGTTATFIVQNPYIGSGGAVYNSQGIWAITSLESGPLEYTAGLVLSSAIFAGHDYVSASFGGIQSTTGTGAATGAKRGWSWSIFASDKRYREHTIFSPWNLQGAGGIIGSIMRETGTVTLGLTNNANKLFPLDLAGGGTGFAGTFHVHVKASLCGSPFNPDVVHKMFVPFNKQLTAAHAMAASLPRNFGPMFQGLSAAQQSIRGLEDDLENISYDY